MHCLYSFRRHYNANFKLCVDLSTATQVKAGKKQSSILAESCVQLRSSVAVVHSSIHNIPQVCYLPQHNAMQVLESYCEPALMRGGNYSKETNNSSNNSKCFCMTMYVFGCMSLECNHFVIIKV